MRRPERLFAFRLALALGMTVNQLLSEIDTHELAEWMVYFRYHPFGEERDDLRMATLAAVTANCTPGQKRRYQAKHFIPDFAKAAKAKHGVPDGVWQKDLQVLRGIARQHNQKIAKKALLEPKG